MKEHTHQFESWPFVDAENTAALTTVRVLDGTHPVLLVTHDKDDGMWQLLCGTTDDPGDGRIVCLGCMLERDSTLAQIADLPLGWHAWRDAVGAEWRRQLHPGRADERTSRRSRRAADGSGSMEGAARR
jgi:hypothetical protein